MKNKSMWFCAALGLSNILMDVPRECWPLAVVLSIAVGTIAVFKIFPE